jgi:hypothetical protein
MHGVLLTPLYPRSQEHAVYEADWTGETACTVQASTRPLPTQKLAIGQSSQNACSVLLLVVFLNPALQKQSMYDLADP